MRRRRRRRQQQRDLEWRSAATLDTTLVFGGPPECLERPLCLGDKEQELYGLDFKEVKKLDPGGPVTVTALQDGTIDVGLLFTGSSVIDDDFVLLEDDKGLQPADNPTAIINESKADDNVVAIVDAVNEALTLDEYNTMALSVFNDKEDPSDVAGAFLERAGLTAGGDSGAGTSLIVGSKDFAGAQLLSQAYGQALAANGYDISYKDNIGPDGDGVPARQGRHDRPLRRVHRHVPDVPRRATPTGDSAETYDLLTTALAEEGVVATTPSSAQDVNGFYVTKETADKYSLVTVSDLKQPRRVTHDGALRSGASGRSTYSGSTAARPTSRRSRLVTSRGRSTPGGGGVRWRSSCRDRGPAARACRPAT